ncbi:hypothetical protein ACFY40_27765 [Streptomyces sp. NPDC012950]|uniref:hypothetical protein n=1 Tax=Streptomyces sp. NPDC012950 TaxID=3364858 RepID=UPI0036CB0DFA
MSDHHPSPDGTEGIAVLDQELAAFSRTSLLALLRAALESPGCARFHDPLRLAWTRAVAGPEHKGRTAAAGDLLAILQAAGAAGSDLAIMTDRLPNDVRDRVRFDLGDTLYLVHPGELSHPLMVLRALEDAADALDDHLVKVCRFGIGDVLELALRHTDHAILHLAPSWPPAAEEDIDPGEIQCVITDAEVAAAAGLDTDHLHAVGSRGPERTAAALAYLTRHLDERPLIHGPGAPVLGPTLLVATGDTTHPVPASTALEAAVAAAADLLQTHPVPPEAQARLRRRTVARLVTLLGLEYGAEEPGEASRISIPSHRLEIAVVATLHDDLAELAETARAELSAVPPGVGRLVVYTAGPRFLGPEKIVDTLYVHIDELTEILSAAGGDLTTVALWVLEITEHPGVDAVAYYDALDAWTAWHASATLLPPGPQREGIVVVGPSGRDVSWARAAVWAQIDDTLAAAGLPPAIGWAASRLTKAAVGEGLWADLAQNFGGRRVRACVSSHPPVVVLATVNSDEQALLDEAAFAGTADGIRGSLAAHPGLAQHFTLPGEHPIRLHLRETTEAHQPPEDLPAHPDDVLPLLISMDEDAARIDIVLDPPFLARFTDDGHHILGRLLHYTSGRVRSAHGVDPVLGATEFAEAWNSALPVIAWYGGDPYAPSPAPHQPLGGPSAHARARALRVAADAVRAADILAGTFTGGAAMGPAGQLLRALEQALADEVRARHPSLLPGLVRYLNTALSDRAHGRQEATTGIARTADLLWQETARQRETEGGIVTNTLLLLIQQALNTPPAGDAPADHIAIADLVALAELLLHAALVAIPASRRLHPVTLTVHQSGIFTLDSITPDAPSTGDLGGAAGDTGFDPTAFRHAQEQAWLSRARVAEPQPLTPDELFTGRIPVDFTALDPAAGSSLSRADRELTARWGCGLDALAAVLAIAADWAPRADGTALTTREELAHEAAAWSRLPQSQTQAAVERLVLGPGNATWGGDHAYAEVERRIRPTTHPLIAHDDGILIAPWLVHTARHLYATALADSRLPRPDVPPKAAQLLDMHRQQQNNQLEKDLKAAAEQAGLAYRANFDRDPAARAGIPGLIGELDLLVADAERGRLWVIEAKNPHRAISTHHRQAHLKKFGEYRDKLLAKTATIDQHAAAAARACGVDTARDWTVIPLFVTPDVNPAAFISDPVVPFTSITTLTAILTASDAPAVGWNTANVAD